MLSAIQAYRNCRSYKKRIKVNSNVPSTFKYLLEQNKKELGKFARKNGIKLQFSQDEKNKIFMDLYYESVSVYEGEHTTLYGSAGKIPLKYNFKKPENPIIDIVDGVLKRMDKLQEQYGAFWRTHFHTSGGK